MTSTTQGTASMLCASTNPVMVLIATEILPAALMARLMPKSRIATDTRKVVYYYRPSPDGRRILFGGRVSLRETDPLVSEARLHVALTGIFPELAQTRISHSWCGFVAYTFDEMMHAGERDGIHYAMGYCGPDVGMAGYLGMRVGQQVLGRTEGRTAFEAARFQTRPFYRGNPWFLSSVDPVLPMAGPAVVAISGGDPNTAYLA